MYLYGNTSMNLALDGDSVVHGGDTNSSLGRVSFGVSPNSLVKHPMVDVCFPAQRGTSIMLDVGVPLGRQTSATRPRRLPSQSSTAAPKHIDDNSVTTDSESGAPPTQKATTNLGRARRLRSSLVETSASVTTTEEAASSSSAGGTREDTSSTNREDGQRQVGSSTLEPDGFTLGIPAVGNSVAVVEHTWDVSMDCPINVPFCVQGDADTVQEVLSAAYSSGQLTEELLNQLNTEGLLDDIMSTTTTTTTTTTITTTTTATSTSTSTSSTVTSTRTSATTFTTTTTATTTDGGGFPWWAWVLIVMGSLVLLGCGGSLVLCMWKRYTLSRRLPSKATDLFPASESEGEDPSIALIGGCCSRPKTEGSTVDYSIEEEESTSRFPGCGLLEMHTRR